MQTGSFGGVSLNEADPSPAKISFEGLSFDSLKVGELYLVKVSGNKKYEYYSGVWTGNSNMFMHPMIEMEEEGMTLLFKGDEVYDLKSGRIN